MPGLLDLSAELRIQIYQHVILHDHKLGLFGWPGSWLAQSPCSCGQHPRLDTLPHYYYEPSNAMRPLDISLTRVSRQLRAETLSIFYGQNDCVIDLHPYRRPKVFLGLGSDALVALRRLTFVLTGSLESVHVPCSKRLATAEYRVDLDKCRTLERVDKPNIYHVARPVCTECAELLQAWVSELRTIGHDAVFTHASMSALVNAIGHPHFEGGGCTYLSKGWRGRS